MSQFLLVQVEVIFCTRSQHTNLFHVFFYSSPTRTTDIFTRTCDTYPVPTSITHAGNLFAIVFCEYIPNSRNVYYELI